MDVLGERTLPRLGRTLGLPTALAAAALSPATITGAVRPSVVRASPAPATLAVIGGARAPAHVAPPPTAATAPRPTHALPGVAGRPECHVAKGTVNGRNRVIVVSLKCQELGAYDHGREVVSTPVSTGPSGHETPTGTYSVTSKDHPWRMVSSRAQATPGWFPDTVVHDAIWWRGGIDGPKTYAMHDWPYNRHYGPGSQTRSGSLGCILVPRSPFRAMQRLAAWAHLGDRVVIER